MKSVGLVATSLITAACASVAISQQSLSSREGSMRSAGSDQTRNCEDKFAPRFDGLRFIETLVTAHR
ncbi:hypothetical protein FCM35_KLT07180 [Carex littledalei]|uniref:Uncharacterized protein n=1 Tax=Carex littledalei TaxID=544730 RepID=A0A833QWC2_9POAL|nr:hypothetical protein FCM35_KLT07180 [Carex littledalei]